MNACDLLVDSQFKSAGSRVKKIFVNGVHYTDGAPGTKAPTAYRWDLKCSSCGKSWSLVTDSARSLAALADCACGGVGFVDGIPVVAHRG